MGPLVGRMGPQSLPLPSTHIWVVVRASLMCKKEECNSKNKSDIQ